MAPRIPDIGVKIKRARERLGWTQQQLADRIGRDRKTVDNWENDRAYPRSSIGALEAALGSLTGEPDPVEEAVRAISGIEWLSPDDRDALIREYRQRHRPHRAAG